MLNKKRILAGSLFAALMLSSTAAGAAQARNGVKDCTANLNLQPYYVECSIFEGGTPMNPVTPKSIVNGDYVSVDVSGYKKTIPLNKSVQTGQLTLKKNAPTNYKSKSATMPYYLNGSYAGVKRASL